MLSVFGSLWELPQTRMLAVQLDALISPGQRRRVLLIASWKRKAHLDRGGFHLWRAKAESDPEAYEAPAEQTELFNREE